MNILYLHQHFSTPRGAAGIRSYEMARRLLHHGHRVTMVCGSYRGGSTGLAGPFYKGVRRGFVDGVDVIEFDLSYSNKDNFLRRTMTFLRFAWGGLRVAFTENYDIAFATSTPLTAGIPAIAARWLRGKPFVFEVRDLWPELPRALGVITNPTILSMMSVLEWLSYRSADRCVALAPGIAEGIKRRGVAPSAIAMIPNGCDVEIFRSPRRRWRPEGVEASDFLAVFTGTHGIANGLDAVLDAAGVLHRRGRRDIKILLIGDGIQKSDLQLRARRDSLDNVIFHPPVDKSALAEMMNDADLGLQILANVPAFYYGTSPNKFFDYLAAGLPVLTNYPGWVADMILKDDCGFAVPPNDPGAFADALEEASANPIALQQKGARAALLAEREFKRADLADEWVAWVLHGRRNGVSAAA